MNEPMIRLGEDAAKVKGVVFISDGSRGADKTDDDTHQRAAFERGTSGDQGQRKGYAASCTCGIVTLGGFESRTDAKDALECEGK